MKSNECFEIFNHFLATGDSAQMLSLAGSVEVFGSSSLSDGRTYIGQQAPAKLREAIQRAAVRRSNVSVGIRHAQFADDHANVVLEIKDDRGARYTLLSLATKNGSMTTFHESRIEL